MAGFRRSHHRIAYHRWRGVRVTPPRGHYTVYWWSKGDIHTRRKQVIDERWVKADIYGPDGQIFLYGVLADTFEDLQQRVPELIQQYRT